MEELRDLVMEFGEVILSGDWIIQVAREEFLKNMVHIQKTRPNTIGKLCIDSST